MAAITTPRFSVITAVFNGADLLETCLQSVAEQRGVDVEHIVIDGGSTDGCVEILKRWNDRLAFWISEPDSGISEAMNKGINRAHGEWLLFLHADDNFYSPDTLAKVSQVIQRSTADIIGFPIRYGPPPGQIKYPRGANVWMRLKTGLMHQGTFIRRTVFDRIGTHDTTLRIAMDYDFFLRAWLADVSMDICRAPIVAHMSDSGVSSKLDWPTLSRRLGEERRIQNQYADGHIQKLGYSTYWLLYRPYKQLMSLFQGTIKPHRRGNQPP